MSESSGPWRRPKSAWREDDSFCEMAGVFWPDDYRLATTMVDEGRRLLYDRGASQRLASRYQGWCAALLARGSLRATSNQH
jgi:hypothetical protein